HVLSFSVCTTPVLFTYCSLLNSRFVFFTSLPPSPRISPSQTSQFSSHLDGDVEVEVRSGEEKV
ncbi:hypothetical protein GBAR_LOCUS28098, partial [Geodia barretti]